jgi:hypothetical protein
VVQTEQNVGTKMDVFWLPHTEATMPVAPFFIFYFFMGGRMIE